MKNVVLLLSWNLTITGNFKTYISPPIYSIYLQEKDIKLRYQGCCASDPILWLKPQTLKPKKKPHVCQQSLKLILKHSLTTKTVSAIPLSGILQIFPLQESQSPALNDSQLRHENWQQHKYPQSTGWYSWQPDGIRTAAKDNTEPGQAAQAPAWKFRECPQVPTPRSFMFDNRPVIFGFACLKFPSEKI